MATDSGLRFLSNCRPQSVITATLFALALSILLNLLFVKDMLNLWLYAQRPWAMPVGLGRVP
jgi:hypothetical protein